MEFSIEPSISHDPNGYQWSVFFNTQLIGGQSDNQYSAQVPFGYNVVDPIYVDVTAINSCGTTSSTITINPYPGDFQPFMKGINLPIDYCGGRSNTFTQKNPIPGIEYRWEFYKNGNTGNPDETAQGIDMYSFTPDFGQVSGGPVGNGGVGPGDVNSYVIVVKGRGGCGAWSTNSEPVSMVTYNGCNGNGQTPSIGTPGGGNPNGGYQIGLVPNPASDHVNVQIPPGGGNDQANIKIVDSFGMIRKDINTNANSENINISDLEVGIYTVTVIQGSNIDSKQLQVMP
jgi:hypothetical protein